MELFGKLVNKLKEYGRVLKITKKPTMDEFAAVSKVTAIGIAIIGLLGFIIHMAAQYITTAFKVA